MASKKKYKMDPTLKKVYDHLQAIEEIFMECKDFSILQNIEDEMESTFLQLQGHIQEIDLDEEETKEQNEVQ